MDEPLPCPFCGKLPESGPDEHGNYSEVRGAYWVVECMECDGVIVCAFAPTKPEAIAAWNLRPAEKS